MKILKSTAIRTTLGEKYSLLTPVAHCEIIQDLYDNGIFLVEESYEFGFLTTDGEFVNREDALIVAMQSGQYDGCKTEGSLYSNEVGYWGIVDDRNLG